MTYPVAVLCGGMATRLGDVAKDVPKSMVRMVGEPFIAHQLHLLRSQGVERVVLCIGHLGHKIRSFVGNGSMFGLRVEYSSDEEHPLGTGGAIRKALPKLDEEFFVLYGDSYLPLCDLSLVQRTFEQHQTWAMMTLFRNDNRIEPSNVHLDGEEIVAYSKSRLTPAMRHIDYGLGVFRRCPFSVIPTRLGDLSLAYKWFITVGQLTGMEMESRFYEIGSLAGLEEVRSLLGGMDGTQSLHEVHGGHEEPVRVGQSTDGGANGKVPRGDR